MIKFTTMVTKEIDEKDLFERMKDFLLDEEIDFYGDDETLIGDLPNEVQRLVFAKVGAMMIDYAESKEF